MHAKEPRKWWKPIARARCVCNLSWPCIESELEKIRVRVAQVELSLVPAETPAAPDWSNAPTAFHPQVGRVGRLTPAQTRRSMGGR